MRRSFIPLRIFQGQRLHQASGDTAMDRFPEIFSACRDLLRGRTELNILSFGCSTGEEVLTLRHYFPEASITGADINARSLALCRGLPVDERIHFIHSDRNAIERIGPFDAIFCLAVLQRHPSRLIRDPPANLRRTYPFARFDEQMKDFDRWAKPRGLLAFYGTAYPLSESSVARNWEAVRLPSELPADGPKYDRFERPLEGRAEVGGIFRKIR